MNPNTDRTATALAGMGITPLEPVTTNQFITDGIITTAAASYTKSIITNIGLNIITKKSITQRSDTSTNIGAVTAGTISFTHT
jgi:hypothetical protein